MGDYPMGAADDPRAPYNEVEAPKKEFKFTVAVTIDKEVTIESSEYCGGWYNDEGFYEKPFYNGVLECDYREQHTPVTEMLKDYVRMLNDEIKCKRIMIKCIDDEGFIRANKRKIAELQRKIDDASGWFNENVEEV